jgi:hypothetical protein
LHVQKEYYQSSWIALQVEIECWGNMVSKLKKNCCYDSNDDVLLVPHIGRTIDIQKKMLQKW